MTKKETLTLKKVRELNIHEGQELYLRQFTGSYYIDIVKRPYTVIQINRDSILVQRAKLIYPIFKYNSETMDEYYKQFDGERVCFYDTVAESIEPNPRGEIIKLVYHPKRDMFGTPGSDRNYPEYAIFGKYEHQPYLD